MKVEEVLELKQQLQAKFDKDMAAINHVAQLLRQGNGGSAEMIKAKGPATRVDEENPSSAGAKNGDTVEAKFLSVINEMNRDFGFPDILQKLSEKYPDEEFNRNTISGLVFRHKGQSFLVVQPGRGRKPAVYARMQRP